MSRFTVPYHLGLAILVSLLLISPGLVAPPSEPPPSALDLEAIDPSVKPYEDFYRYANGKWLDSIKIPEDRPSVSNFTQMQDRSWDLQVRILEETARDRTAPKESAAAKLGAFYRSGMDEKRINEAGAKPLRPVFDRIAAVKDGKGLVKEVARLHLQGVDAVFPFAPQPDFKDTRRTIGVLSPGGFSLLDRSYYLVKEAYAEGIRNAFTAHVEKMFVLLGDSRNQAAAQAETVLRLETHLANAWTKGIPIKIGGSTTFDLNEFKYGYRLMSLEKLEADVPGFAWEVYFEALGLGGLKEVNVQGPAFFTTLSRLMTSIPLADWKVYLRWQVLNHYADKLSRPFEEEDFHFKYTVLYAIPQMRPRGQRVLDAANKLLGDAVGQVYVARVFPPRARTRAIALVQNVKAALRDRLTTLEWMSPETRKEALRKLDALAIEVGFPSKWRDYSALAVDPDVYVGNVMQAEGVLRGQELARIGKPVDRTEWNLKPQTLNASYDVPRNAVVIPAAILQPPLFDPEAEDALNYGAIGTFIGHEITHGFDPNGVEVDADGKIREWWTREDQKAFQELSRRIAEQYDAYVVLDRLHVDGRRTANENIADLGGLKLAYLALQKALKGNPAPPKVGGFTAEQRFFLAYAKVWRQTMRPEVLRQVARISDHSPSRFRVNGPLYNMPEFFEAFGILPEQAGKWRNPNPVRIW